MHKTTFKAIYGTFNLDMLPLRVIDVTVIVSKSFYQHDRLIIPVKTDFNACFGNPAIGEMKFLQIQHTGRKFNILNDEYQLEIEIDLTNYKKQLKLVYFAFINRNSNWQEILSGQLRQLKSYGLLDEVDLYVHITDSTYIFNDVISIINGICRNAMISFSGDNEFEYPAIHLVYDLANQEPDSIIMYLHTKGISYNIQKRKIKEVALVAGTFQNWRKNMEAFKNKKISKIGLFAGDASIEKKEELQTKRGWIWFNFWYARGSYIISNCLKPSINPNRFYYEVWLAGPPGDVAVLDDDCYSIYTQTNMMYFNSFEADYGLKCIAEQIT